MEKLELKLINCYGIQALDYEYDFGAESSTSRKKSKWVDEISLCKDIWHTQ